ncbi:MAG TPA: efflux RND transporter periplasmic adaptor subunit [Verrucomicrobiae bacterium]|nr:efflux RND transporter periplasmic adaptor subunit [Verrucomicrobiae bacterium]
MKLNLFLRLIPFLAAAIFLSGGCSKHERGGAKPDAVAYYTCAMHTSVRSQDPHGKCPICGMDLVPVTKKDAAKQKPGERTYVTAPSSAGQMLGMPGMGEERKGEGKEPVEFNIPVKRQQQIGVTYGVVEKEPFKKTVRTIGTVTYDKARHWDYVARTEGYVEQLSVFSRGEVVEKGAPLLTIYSPDLLTAQNEFIALIKTRDGAKAKGQQAVVDSTEGLIKAAKERLRLWNITEEQISELQKTQTPQETLTLYSPFRGVAQEIAVDQGRRVRRGDHLVEVADLSVVWVWARFYQDEIPMLKKGLRVAISTESLPGEKFEGRISVIDPFLNDQLRTGRARIDVKNPGFKLRPGMYVNARLTADMGEGLALPAGAVLPTGEHNVIFVSKGEGNLEPRFVELGRKYGQYYEVKSGVREGERVVTSANFLIDAEAKVQAALKSW